MAVSPWKLCLWLSDHCVSTGVSIPSFEVDGIEESDAVFCLNKGIPHLKKRCAFRVGQNIGAVKLKEIRLNPEPRLTGAGTADDQHILISRIGGILWPVAHHEPLCLGEEHIVFKNRIHEWRNVIRAAPGSVLSSTFLYLWTLFL